MIVVDRVRYWVGEKKYFVVRFVAAKTSVADFVCYCCGIQFVFGFFLPQPCPCCASLVGWSLIYMQITAWCNATIM